MKRTFLSVFIMLALSLNAFALAQNQNEAVTDTTSLQPEGVQAVQPESVPQTAAENQASITGFVTKDELAAAKQSGVDIVSAPMSAGQFIYKWSIFASTIGNADADVMLGISNDLPQTPKIKSILPTDSAVLTLAFEQTGDFPFSAEVSFEGAALADGTYYLHRFNKASAKGEYIQDVEIKDGRFNLSVSSGTTYFISNNMVVKTADTGMDSYTKLLIEVAAAMAVAVVLGLIVSKLRAERGKKSDLSDFKNEISAASRQSDESDDYLYDDGQEDTSFTEDENITANQALGEIGKDDVLIFDDDDEFDGPGYGYGYKPAIDEIFFSDDEDEDEYGDYEYVDQTNSDGLIIEDDELEIADYTYDIRFSESDDPIYGLILTDNDPYESPMTIDRELLFEEDEDD